MSNIAVCEIWKISSRLDTVINYTTNEEKTDKELFNELHKVIEYDKNDMKTERQLYVSGINCNVDTALEEMVDTKKKYNKQNGILGYHAIQSFKEGEVTPEMAHSIGIKTAEEMWGDRFEVIVSTHLNTKNYHNHFVINSVSFKDGKKYYDNRNTYAEFRHISDSICNELGLSVIANKKTKRGINYENYYKGYVKKSNYYSITKEDIDSAIKQAYSYYDFERILSSMGYDLIYRGKNLSVRHNNYKKNIRISRAYGSEYSKENIMKRIDMESASREAIYISGHKRKFYKYKKEKSPFYKLFIHYYWLLKVAPKKYPTKYVSPLIRADVKKMELISNEAKLLVRNNINTYEEFLLYKNKLSEKVNELKNEREKIWKKSKDMEGMEKYKIMDRVNEINRELEPLNKENYLCRDIEIRNQNMIAKLNEYEKEERTVEYESR